MYTYRAAIVDVIDGDTVVADIDLGFGVWLRKQRIRLAKINSPELKGATLKAAQDARDFLKKLILNKTVTLQTEKDGKEKYGRWLATILLEEDKILVDINKKMVVEGRATTYK